MKILYAIQATGNGHITRAKELIPYLQKNIEVDVLLSGTSADVELGLPVRFYFKGLSFVFGKNGGINFWKTILQMNFWRFLKDVKQLPLKEYDFVISDFEPVSAWACILHKKHCIAMSHQYSLLNKNTPKPKKKILLSHLILKYYAPVSVGYGFHFKPYASSIYTPVIQKELKSINPIKKNYFVVYLPAFEDKKLLAYYQNFTKQIGLYFLNIQKKNTKLAMSK